MANRKTSDKAKLAEIMYVDGDMTQKDIAAELGISPQTMNKWCERGRWKDKKALKMIEPQKLIQNQYDLILKIQEIAKQENRSLTAKETDQLAKMAAFIDRLEKKISPSVAMRVFIDFNNYVKVHDVNLAKALIPFQKSYIQLMLGGE